MSSSQNEDRSDKMILGVAAFVIGASLCSALLVMTSDCSAIFGLILWAVTAVTFVFGILFPTIGRLIRGTMSTRAARRPLIALLAMGVPLILLYLENYSHMAGCVG